MNKIKNILICGLGAIGGYYASKFYDTEYTLKILVDEPRFRKYTKTPRIINNKRYDFDYILPNNSDYDADLIIISTKSSGLKSAVENIKNFVSDKTVILSFLNGITSEKEIIKHYGEKVLYSYLLGHTFFRTNNLIEHDGHARIIFGSATENDSRIDSVKNVFDNLNIEYTISNNIIESLWQKFAFNCCANQLSAITRFTFGEMKSSEKCLNIMEHICSEISFIAEKEGLRNINFYESVLNSLELMIPEGKTSMLQDVEAGIKPEVDLFGGTIKTLGEKYNIKTPYNTVLSDLISALII